MMRTVVIALALVGGCGKSKENPAPVATGSGSAAPVVVADAAVPAEVKSPVLDLAGMDKTVKPGDDFYSYANGAWTKATEIPADRSGWGTGAIVSERTEKRLTELITDAAANAPPGSEARKVADFYTAFLDTATIEKKGMAPLQPELDAIAAIKDPKELAHWIGATLRADVDAINNTNFETANLLGVWVAQDLTDPTKYLAYLMQGGLGMPSRDFYVDASKRMSEMRDKYQAHIVTMLKLAGIAEPDAKATQILALETAFAKVHATRLQSEDIKNGTVRWKRDELASKAPGLDWVALLDGAGLSGQPVFGVWHAKAIAGMAAVAKATPLDTWKAYLQFHAIDRHAGFLPKAFSDEAFAFYGTALGGVPTQRERAKRAVAITSGTLGEPVGKLYVAKYFSAEAKQKITVMVKNILAAFDHRIDGLAWMAPATKAKAKAKLAVLKVAVGYPDNWRDYTGLEIAKDDAFGNAERAAKFEYAWNLAKLGKPVDRDEWVMTPQLVNAVNLPAMNAMNFPAGILQPPYFDPSRPEAMDYGAIGAVIGHEISHSFDDTGAQFDAAGRLSNWWTKEDFKRFEQQGEALVKQYAAYKPFPDLAVNGKQTLGENIADVAGLAVAYDAYKAANKDAPVWEGLTGDQQFFISFAQTWRSKLREPALRRRILTDGHSPGEYRAATVRNEDTWYAAFGIKPDEKLFLAPEARVRVW
ncbi:MAG: M13 family metallopeptidase [Kofleriaceae bacterium]